MESNLSDLYTLSLPAGEGFLHYAVVLAQHPAPFYQLGVNSPWGGEAMGTESVFLRGLRGPLGMVDVEDDISFRHVEVPGDDGGGLGDLDQHLQEDVRRLETHNGRQQVINHIILLCYNVEFVQQVAP